MKKALSILVALIVMLAPMGAFAEGGSGHTISAKNIHIEVINKVATYNGDIQRPVVRVFYLNSKDKKVYLKEGKDYSKKWVVRTGLPSNMHTCTTPHNYQKGYEGSSSNYHYMRVKVTLNAPYSGVKYLNTTMTINKASQPVKFSKTSASVRYSKSKARTVSMTYKATPQKGTYSSGVKHVGKVTAKKVSGSKYLYLDKKGNIKVKKGTKKGTYKIKIKATAKQTRNYKTTSTTKTVTVKVK